MKNGSGLQICSMLDVSAIVFKISEVTLQGKLGNRPMRGKEKEKAGLRGCRAAGPTAGYGDIQRRVDYGIYGGPVRTRGNRESTLTSDSAIVFIFSRLAFSGSKKII